MATITWSLLADFDGSGSYETDLTPYVNAPASAARVSRGIGRDGKPRAGKLTFVLDNADGTFTPENSASPYYGLLVPGVPVQLTATHNAIAYTVATAYAMRWKCSFPIAGLSRCEVQCEDLFWFLANGEPVNLQASTSRTTTDALNAICDQLGLTAGDRNFDTGAQSLPMHFCVGDNPLKALQAVVASEMGGQLWPDAAGRIRFEWRGSRLGVGSVDDTWGRGSQVGARGEDYDLNPMEYVTNVTARATVFHTGQADTLLWEDTRNMFTNPATSLALAAGEVYERVYQAGSAFYVLTALAQTTDYLANSAADGSGTDQTSALTVTLTDLGGGFFVLRRENTSTATIYNTKMRVRGQPVEFFTDQSIAQFSLAASRLKAGLSLQFDLPFSGDSGGKVRDYAYQELRVGRIPFPVLQLPFRALIDADIAAMLNVELGDLIRYASPAVDVFQNARVDDWWYVEGLEYSIPPDWGGEWFDVTVTLIPSYVYRNLDAIAFDLFDRADAAGGLGRATSDDGWANSSGFDIVSNVARANTDTLSIPDLDVGVSDQVVEVQLANIGAGDEVGVTLRKSDANNYLRAYVDAGTNEVILERIQAGVVTELSSPAFTVGTAHEMRCLVQGNRIRVYVDGKLYIDTTDASLSSGPKAGMMARNASGTTTFANFYAQGLNLSDGAAAPALGVTRPLRRGGQPAFWRRRRRRMA